MDLGKRVEKRRVQLGMTQAQLGLIAGLAQNSIHNIESGETKRPRKIDALAEALNCTPEYLLFGIGEVQEDEKNINNNVSPGPTLKAAVPLISWVQAGAWSDINEVREFDADRYLCPVKCSDQTFALKVQGVSMEPKFYDGDLIFVDPQADCIHGSYVVARLDDDNQATFKQLIIESGHKFLKAANPNWPDQLIPINGNCTLVGKVVFAGKSF
ncbi:MAG: SOS-response transcriptional repressor LexA [Pseudoalteromonas rhizosphaerae]|jgi:SOS-response transcriptional repressor LexA|uniref:LexA family protein n=1 Tax=Pseudoalteromonas rhizosphaerae TaxID=2518973 RepID=UPI0039E33BA6